VLCVAAVRFCCGDSAHCRETNRLPWAERRCAIHSTVTSIMSAAKGHRWPQLPVRPSNRCSSAAYD
jgi:hypothetical protein